MSTMLPHEKYTRARILTGPEAVDLIVNDVFSKGKMAAAYPPVV